MFVFCLDSSIRGNFCFICNFLYFPKYPQWLAQNTCNQEQMRHSWHQGQEGLATSRLNLDGDRSCCYDPNMCVYGTHLCLPSLCTVQRNFIFIIWKCIFLLFLFCCARKHALQICCFISMLYADWEVIDGCFEHTSAKLGQKCTCSRCDGSQNLGWASERERHPHSLCKH